MNTQLYDKHKSALYNFIAQRVELHEDREDLCQETFIRAFIHYSTFKRRCAFKTWLFTIAKNVCIDFLRRKSIESRVFEECFSNEKRLITVDNPLKYLERKEALNVKLPKRMKQVYDLYKQGLTQPEIAIQLNVTRGTVAAHMYNIKQKMRRHNADIILVSKEEED